VKPLFTFEPGTGFWYRVHPMAKGVTAAVAVLTVSLQGGGLVVAGCLCATILLLGAAGGLRAGEALTGLRSLTLLFLVMAGFQLLQPEGTWQHALESCFRLAGVFLVSGFFVMSASQSELMFFWEGCFRPLGLIGLPSRELALVMVIAVRFLPVFFAEIERIRMAQSARGANFAGNGWTGAAKRYLPLLIPVLELSIRRAEELAVAMEARGYCLHSPRSRYRVYHFSGLDVTILTIILAGSFVLLGGTRILPVR